MSAAQIRNDLGIREAKWQPFWFKQASDLGTFNVIDELLRVGMRGVVETHPRQHLQRPTDLGSWSQHIRLLILTCGAFFDAFYPPYEQLVGGGADIVAARWPTE
jgi:hypothetical protein